MTEQEKKTHYKKDLYPDVLASLAYVRTSVEQIRDTAIVIPDTSVLFVPYEVEQASLDDIQVTYRKLADAKRLKVPAHVIREFLMSRNRKITELMQTVSTLRVDIGASKIAGLESKPLLNAMPEFKTFMDRYQATLNAWTVLYETIRSQNWDDPVSRMYREVFNASSVIDDDIDWDAASVEFKQRCANKVAPGYKDKDNEDKRDGGIGDYLIWKTILDYGRNSQLPVIFVCGELKSDWVHVVDRMPVLPRYELIEEFRRASGGHGFYFLSFQEFLKLYGAQEKTIQQVMKAELTSSGEGRTDSDAMVGDRSPDIVLWLTGGPLDGNVVSGQPALDVYNKTNGVVGKAFMVEIVQNGKSIASVYNIQQVSNEGQATTLIAEHVKNIVVDGEFIRFTK